MQDEISLARIVSSLWDRDGREGLRGAPCRNEDDTDEVREGGGASNKEVNNHMASFGVGDDMRGGLDDGTRGKKSGQILGFFEFVEAVFEREEFGGRERCAVGIITC